MKTMRKEINISERTIIKLQRLADKEGRKLKPYMERILVFHANDRYTEKQITLFDQIKTVKPKKKKGVKK
jgi:hypothetical protein